MNPSDAIHSPDQEILKHYRRDHNNEWLGILLDRYLHLIFGVCMKYLKNEENARDQAQQICLKVLKTLPHHQVTYFKSWLYQVARNHCLMLLRQSKHVRMLPLSDNEGPVSMDSPGGESDSGEREASYLRLEQALETLNEAQRRCVELFYLQKKTYQRVSEITGYSLLQVKSHIQNGKRNLKLIMQRLGEDPGDTAERTGKDRGKI